MIAVCGMTMICPPAKPEIDVMCGNDKNHRRNKQPDVDAVKDLFSDQEKHAQCEDRQRKNIVVMLAKAVHQRNTSHAESEKDHEILEHVVLNDVNTKDGQTADHQRQHRTVNRTCQRCGNSYRVPIEFFDHRTKLAKCNKVAKDYLCSSRGHSLNFAVRN